LHQHEYIDKKRSKKNSCRWYG